MPGTMTKERALALAGSWSALSLQPSILACGVKPFELQKEFSGVTVSEQVGGKFDLIVADLDNAEISVADFALLLNERGALVAGSSSPLKLSLTTSQMTWRLDTGAAYTTYFCLPQNVQENHHFLQAACYDAYVEEYSDDVEFLKKWIDGASSVLEVGVGTGRLARVLTPLAKNYIGIDTSAAMLRTLRRRGVMIETSQASMLDFDAGFIARWKGKSVTYSFTGPDGREWFKTDHMDFSNHTMFRRIELMHDGIVVSQTSDDLTWVSAVKLSEICTRAGFDVTNIYPAYTWQKISNFNT